MDIERLRKLDNPSQIEAFFDAGDAYSYMDFEMELRNKETEDEINKYICENAGRVIVIINQGKKTIYTKANTSKLFMPNTPNEIMTKFDVSSNDGKEVCIRLKDQLEKLDKGRKWCFNCIVNEPYTPVNPFPSP